MASEGKSRIFKHTRGKTLYLTIPSSVATDSTFPFKIGENVKIKIKGNKLVIEK